MNTAKLRSKRVLLPSIAAVTVLAVGGPAWAATANDDPQGNERDRIGTAAVKAVGGGTAVDVEASDDRGEAYEVEVRTKGGTETDVALDKDLEVVGQDADDRDDDRDERDGEGRDADERALSASERAKAEKAAKGAVRGGTVIQVEASDDRGEAYEVEVRDADDAEWDIELDSDYTVLHKSVDD